MCRPSAAMLAPAPCGRLRPAWRLTTGVGRSRAPQAAGPGRHGPHEEGYTHMRREPQEEGDAIPVFVIASDSEDGINRAKGSRLTAAGRQQVPRPAQARERQRVATSTAAQTAPAAEPAALAGTLDPETLRSKRPEETMRRRRSSMWRRSSHRRRLDDSGADTKKLRRSTGRYHRRSGRHHSTTRQQKPNEQQPKQEAQQQHQERGPRDSHSERRNQTNKHDQCRRCRIC